MPNDMMMSSPSDARIVPIDFHLIDQNPARDLIGNPLRLEQIQQLAASVRSTGYWHNAMVRPHPTQPDRYQLAYGHARLEAAKLTGLTRGSFTVRQLTDDQMIRVMANENVTQFGKDSFKTYKEATVAAATFIMREVLNGAAGKFTSGAPDRDGQWVAEVLGGGCPGREVIARFFEGALNSEDIKLALQTFRDTGELAAWHKANNPQAKPAATKPMLDPEALKRFDKPDHVRTFADAVRETNTPIGQQAKIADDIVADLGAPPRKSRNGREVYQADRPSDKRFNSGNIRKGVVRAAVERTHSPKRKAEIAHQEQMNDLERALTECATGATRLVNGYDRVLKIVEVMGGVKATDMTAIAARQLESFMASVEALQDRIRGRRFKTLLRIREQGQ